LAIETLPDRELFVEDHAIDEGFELEHEFVVRVKHLAVKRELLKEFAVRLLIKLARRRREVLALTAL